MEPRLPTSKKWTAFPKEYTQQIREAFLETFPGELKGVKLVVEGRIYPQEILLRIGMVEQGRIFQANFETSIAYNATKEDTLERIYNCIDATGDIMNEYFQHDEEADEELDLPRTWKGLQIDNEELFFKFSTENTELEAEANAILGNAEKALVHGDDESTSDDALDHAVETIDEDPDQLH